MLTMSQQVLNHGCLSVIARQFVDKVIYAQISKEEALNACEAILNHTELSKHDLLHSLIQNKILSDGHKDILMIQNTSLQAIVVKLTDCYSPLCTSSTKCYSPTCPRRSLDHLHLIHHSSPLSTLDSNIPECLLNTLSSKERKRQLAIEELRNYEHNFLRQLRVIHDLFAQPLLQSTAIEVSRRHLFHDHLFGNYLALATLHKGLFRDLKLSSHHLFPDSVTLGHLLIKHVSRLLDPYILYVTNYVTAKHHYDLEYRHNPAFQQFLQHQESIEREFRMTLKGLLISPIVRIAKYDLLFTTIMNHSDEQQVWKDLIEITKKMVHQINEATRLAESAYRITQIRQALRHRPLFGGIPDDARLLFEGQVDLIKLSTTTCQLFLWSDALMITRKKLTADGQEEYILMDRPIPLVMLRIGKIARMAVHQHSLLSSLWSQPTLSSESLSGFKIRHRLRSLQQRIRRSSSKTDVLSHKRSNSLPFFHSRRSPRLQKSATYPSSLDPPRLIRSRLLSLSHMADPALNYLFECPSVDDRLLWRSKIKSALPQAGPFDLRLVCAVTEYPYGYPVHRRPRMGCGTIWCSLVFKTLQGQDMIALGTVYGVWIARLDGQSDFRQILPYNCQQLELFEDQILIVKAHKPNQILGGIHLSQLDPLRQSTTLAFPSYFKPIHPSGVVYFATGTLRGNPILCYLRRKRTGSIRLVLMFYRADHDLAAPWFIKFKEYKPLFIQPSELRIAHDMAFIRSKSEGVEKIDLYRWIYESSLDTFLFRRPTYSSQVDLPFAPLSLHAHQEVSDPALTIAGFIPLDDIEAGIICSGKWAYATMLPQAIEFEAESKAVAVFYPYLISFSSCVIEIRHLETMALVQAIPGRKIRCVYVHYSDESTYTKANMIHVSMFYPEENQTKVYELYLK
ncbi:hypothetical protein EDC96DRAFT_608822 [Choanephora cucurbitarum]|nr:hypothetical protein EDC96DRAFT_608822 [Choanephora cucurbitarum]